MSDAPARIGCRLVPVRIVEWRIHQHDVATRGRKTHGREIRSRRCHIKRCRTDAIGKLVARGILGRKRRKMFVDLDERYANAGDPGGKRKAGRADPRAKFGGAVAVSGRGRGRKQDGVMPKSVAAARLQQAQAAAENRIIGEIGWN